MSEIAKAIYFLILCPILILVIHLSSITPEGPIISVSKCVGKIHFLLPFLLAYLFANQDKLGNSLTKTVSILKRA